MRRKKKAVQKIPMKKKAKPRKRRVKRASVIRTRGGGMYTEAEYFQKIRAGLRSSFRFWPVMMQVLKDASRPSQSSNKRLKTEYQCVACGGWFPRKEVQIDHIEECGSLSCYEDIVPFIQRLTIEDPSGYQILCKEDHSIKTKAYKDGKKQKI